MIVAVLDCGSGNLHSLAKALTAGGATVRITDDPAEALAARALVIPGVGAFGPAAACLRPARDRLRAALADGHPCLGICLGMQLLFEASEESPGEGLGFFSGRATRLAARRVPHIGWNQVNASDDAAFGSASIRDAYFAHSFACRPDDPSVIVAWSEHESDRFAAAVRRSRTLGVQFHPEKSSRAGLALLRAWLVEAAR